MTRKTIAIAAVMVLGAALPAAAADAHRSIEGYWEPPLDNGTKFVERPELTDKGKAAVAHKKVSLDSKDGVPIGSRYCLPLPYPWNLFQSAPISVVQDERETMMMYEGHSIPSHIYTDGRDHSGAAKLKFQVNGHSIGHWEGDTFVVDTVHFFDNDASPGGAFAGGVPNSNTSHLVARYTASADGKSLDGTFTVDDRELLVKPYTWTFHWKRSDPGNYANVGECDPSDLSNSAH